MEDTVKGPSAVVGPKTWPWILGILLLLFGLTLYPPFGQVVLSVDNLLARWCNGLLGHNRLIDEIIGGINSKDGDKVVVLGFALFILVHIFRVPLREEIAARLAYWLWFVILFLLLYQGQRLVEDALDRDSPGRALDGWVDINDLYDDMHAKTTNKRSFPSGHAMAYYFIALMTIRSFRMAGGILLAVALIVPETRIITGAHWPSDIFLGSLPLAILSAALAHETKARGLYHLIHQHVRLWMNLPGMHKKRRIPGRIRSALRAFLSDDD